MNTADTPTPTPKLTKLLLVGVASATLAIGAATTASASTDTTEPGGETTEHTEAGHGESTATLAVDGSADPTSPEAEAFCSAELAVEAAMASEDPALIGPAVEALSAAAGPADATAVLEPVLANVENQESPEFAEAYAGMVDWMKTNCGYAEVDATASEYTFEGIPAEIPAGGTIFSLENAGEEVHELAVMRINDDVTLSVEEILALPEEEAFAMVTPAAFAFAFPGTVSYGTTDLTPGNYFALCFLPEGATPEVLMQLEEAGGGPDETIPPGIEVGPPHFTLGMVHEFTVS